MENSGYEVYLDGVKNNEISIRRLNPDEYKIRIDEKKRNHSEQELEGKYERSDLMLYSNARKLSLSGWLQKNNVSAYRSPLRMQNFL